MLAISPLRALAKDYRTELTPAGRSVHGLQLGFARGGDCPCGQPRAAALRIPEGQDEHQSLIWLVPANAASTVRPGRKEDNLGGYVASPGEQADLSRFLVACVTQPVVYSSMGVRSVCVCRRLRLDLQPQLKVAALTAVAQRRLWVIDLSQA